MAYLFMQVVNTPMLPTKFLCLKHLTICLRSGHSPYDYFSLVSFLEASPSLETLSLDVRCFQFYPAKMTIRSVGSNNYAFFVFIGVEETYEPRNCFWTFPTFEADD